MNSVKVPYQRVETRGGEHNGGKRYPSILKKHDLRPHDIYSGKTENQGI